MIWCMGCLDFGMDMWVCYVKKLNARAFLHGSFVIGERIILNGNPIILYKNIRAQTQVNNHNRHDELLYKLHIWYPGVWYSTGKAFFLFKMEMK